MRFLGWRVVAVFAVTVAVLSQGLELLRSALFIDGDVVALVQYGPVLAALVTWLVFRRRIAEILPTPVSGRQVRSRLGLAVAVCALIAVLLWIVFAVIGGRSIYGFETVGGMPFVVLALVWLIGATAEEIGWRGMLQPLLESVLPRWGAAIVTGLLWSVWHLPVITQSLAIAVGYTASTVVFSLLLAYLGDGSAPQRVLVTSLVHWLVNLAILVVAGNTIDLPLLVPYLAAISVVTAFALSFLSRALGPRRRRPATKTA